MLLKNLVKLGPLEETLKSKNTYVIQGETSSPYPKLCLTDFRVNVTEALCVFLRLDTASISRPKVNIQYREALLPETTTTIERLQIYNIKPYVVMIEDERTLHLQSFLDKKTHYRHCLEQSKLILLKF